ncbi:LysR family transcriptional regulator [Quadrisphaera sp. DSM 44207]|uniref:LysR family transcriptional regulator n=1 Tax=Quadrisphaera sp. DSM 44207 TaxID=1881057 RepID=UPI0008907871|nr:LysR family transcriptional regulator [Quadrisphaera sp. DSM 44207]SDQ89519.1 transcriptional regulator, LysR family [Quadrisphaera sp. DSM 44207]
MHLDLNLLTTLDALLEEGSVSGAADRLHLSPPAMSRALGRLRRATGDEVLVRTGRTMTPTPWAVAVRAQVHALVQQAHAVLSPDRDLDPASLDRTFALRWHDAVTATVGPALLARVRERAPGVRLRFLPETSDDPDDLRHGRVDLEVHAGSAAGGVRYETVAHDHLVVVLRAGHPAAANGELSLERYAAAEHVTVSRRGRLRDAVDDALEARGLARRVVAAAPTASAALHFVRSGDLIAAVPSTAASALAGQADLQRLPLPLDLPPVPLGIAWHQRYDGDPAHAWLRDLVRTALRAASSGQGQEPPAAGGSGPSGAAPARPR